MASPFKRGLGRVPPSPPPIPLGHQVVSGRRGCRCLDGCELALYTAASCCLLLAVYLQSQHPDCTVLHETEMYPKTGQEISSPYNVWSCFCSEQGSVKIWHSPPPHRRRERGEADHSGCPPVSRSLPVRLRARPDKHNQDSSVGRSGRHDILLLHLLQISQDGAQKQDGH